MSEEKDVMSEIKNVLNLSLIFIGLILFSSCSEDDDSYKLTIDNEETKDSVITKDTLILSSESFIGLWIIVEEILRTKYHYEEDERVTYSKDNIGDTLEFTSDKKVFIYNTITNNDTNYIGWYETENGKWSYKSKNNIFESYVSADLNYNYDGSTGSNGWKSIFIYGKVLEYSPYLIIYNDNKKELPNDNYVSIQFKLEKVE